MRVVRSFLVPMLGMTFFWSYFRFYRFFGILYPSDSSYDIFDVPIHVSLVFIAELFALGLICIAARNRINRMMHSRKAIVLACSAAGSVGAFAVLSLQQGEYSLELLGMASLLVAVGLAANCLAWGMFFSADFCMRDVCILVASYLTSLILLPIVDLFLNTAFVLIAPLISGIAWFFSPQSEKRDFDQSFSSLRSISFCVPLIVVFVIAGSATRGAIYLTADEGVRQERFVVMAVLVCAMFWYCCGKPNPFSETSRTVSAGTYDSVEKAVFKSWGALVLLFLFGLFVSSVLPHSRLGGDVVVVVRSFLNLLLWIVLCDLAFRKRISPILLFVICGLFVEAFCWCLSYVLVPILLHLSGEGLLLQGSIGLVAVFALCSSVIVIFSFIARRRDDEDLTTGKKDTQPREITNEIAARYRLTNREVEIANMFVQGRSLKKVASMLVISPSTAQSHIKSVYRKLDIHSKDELIDFVETWNGS